MGRLVNGEWSTDWYETKQSKGAFVRPDTVFQRKLTKEGPFPPSAERYHLYVSLACPWAHRTLVVRCIKGLEAILPVSVVNPLMYDDGWSFLPGEGSDSEPNEGVQYVRELYCIADAQYTGRVTVPILWDKVARTIVNNESSQIIRIFNETLSHLGSAPERDLYPAALRERIDAVNEWVYPWVNNGVYRAGFATTQHAYEMAVAEVFKGLDLAESILADQPFLCGDVVTEADWRLWTTLIRFDMVYATHFKCTMRRLVDYPHLFAFTRQLYQVPGIAETTHFGHIRDHYYRSHPMINPTRIVPVEPTIDFSTPHERGPIRYATLLG